MSLSHGLALVAGAAAAVLLALAATMLGIVPTSADTARVLPAPALDAPAGQATSETIVLAGGCFWGVQGVFQHVEGVTSAVSGYAGGEQATAFYEKVTRGGTGHAEAVRITYDPARISLGRLLQIYFSVAHDPTELDRQGPDVGAHYRSAIFPTSEAQGRIARAYIDQLGQASAFHGRIVTTIEAGRPFYPAEAYHQDYITRHPNQPYVVINDLPKVANLKRLFADYYRAEPMLVAKTGVSK